ncbi:hypothetical protein [Agaribacter marinus]|uniref:Uncharacterized protein n=1 Tax=Agaribacter marinus TaxID=1431249 RepID=A0AA37WGM8_9ALTE|nr:hypothetical protein [Agaribacter marinus]GLR70246.1 hypothetical protein GCM10007852_11540 [Agaribacter marinus]
MNTQTKLHELHKELIENIEAEQQQEIALSQQEIYQQGLEAQGHCACDNDSFDIAGINTKALSELESRISEQDTQAYLETDAIMAQESESVGVDNVPDIDTSLLPEGAQILTPSWSQVFSDSTPHDEMAQSTDISPQAIIGGGNCKNVWNWAKGGGGGCIGGVGRNTQTVYWTFWFKPKVSRFYSIKPRFQFNGYYIAKANDKWYNCKNTRVRVSARTQAHQYNWKHRDSVDLININSSNININKRLDDNRFTNYSTLLGKNDWTAIVCSVQLQVRAQGGGSYAKNDFSTGANKVCVPYVVVT